MRTIALPSMMEILAKNYNNRNASAALYELAREYIPTTPDELPVEKNTLIAGLYGDGADFFQMKGIVEELLNAISVYDYDVEACCDNPSYHPGRCANLVKDGRVFGVMGEIHPAVAENYGMDCRVYSFSLDADALFELSQPEKTYKPLPKFPAVTRDLALLCDESIPVGTLKKAIVCGGGSLLEAIQLFDVYQGAQIEAGKKSVAFSITLRSADSTLTDEQTNSVMKKVMKELEKEGAVLRS